MDGPLGHSGPNLLNKDNLPVERTEWSMRSRRLMGVNQLIHVHAVEENYFEFKVNPSDHNYMA